MQTHYVVGFLFDPQRTRVVLIEKLKPDFQKGKLNGVGGKIEDGESPLDAMIREFREEGGIEIVNWREFCQLKFRNSIIYFFAAEGEIDKVSSITDEQIKICALDKFGELNVMANLRWLIPMALDKDRVTAVVEDFS